MRPFYIFFLFSLPGIWACKKSEPDSPGPQGPWQELVIPGETVGFGAEFLDPAEYEKIQLIREPLIKENPQSRIQKDPVLAKTYDLSPKMPPVGNQGLQSSCTAWAAAYAARSYFHKVLTNHNYVDNSGKRNDAGVFSPAFVYNQINGGNDRGAFSSNALELIKTIGVCTWADMPYADNDYLKQPDNLQKQKAASYKIKDWGRINVAANTFKKFLYFDYPIIISGVLDQNFFDLPHKDERGEYIWKERSSFKAGHAMVVVGYDDDRKAFKVQNSWGTSWANKGYIWIAYDLIQAVVREAYVMVIDDSSILTPPTVETGEATVSPDGKISFSGAVTKLGDAPVTGLGICISDNRRELPVIPNYIHIEEVGHTPYDFTFTTQLAADTIWYRAFAQTVSGTVYGETAHIAVGNGGNNTGIDKNMLVFTNSYGDNYAINADDGSLIWEVKSKYGDGSPWGQGGVIADGTFAVESDGLRGFDLAEGKLKWKSSAFSPPSESRTSPVAIDGLVIYQGANQVYALDAASGIVKWTIDVRSLGSSDSRTQSFGLSLTKDGRVTFNVSSLDKPAHSKLFFINDPKTGKSLTPLDNHGEPVHDNPFFDNNFMVISNGMGEIKAFSLAPSPKLLWKSNEINSASTTMVGEAVIGYGTKSIKALDKTTGAKLWEYTPEVGSIAYRQWSVSGNYVCMVVTRLTGPFGGDVFLHVVQANTGKLVWSKEIEASSLTVPLSAESKIYVKTDRGLVAFDIRNGNEVWKSPIAFRFNSAEPDPMCLVTKEGKSYYIPSSGMN